MEDLLGKTLLKQDKTVSTKEALTGKVVGLYFSAHWCPPCRTFTPILGKQYTNFVQHGKNLEIVFVSSDRDDKSFHEYYETMPFLALPFEDRKTKEKLSKQFGIKGIPTLLIFDEKGELINNEGRMAIMNDLEGKEYPWRKKTLRESLPEELVSNKNEKVKTNELLDKTDVFGLYFSAHWCGPCRNFTPVLSKTYEKLKEEGKKFELIFVSLDREDEAFEKYHSTMPWNSIPYDDKTREELAFSYSVESIPTLLIFDTKTGKLITDQGVMKVTSGQEFPWKSKPLEVLNEGTVENFQDNDSFLIFVDEKQKETLKTVVQPVAEAVFKDFEQKKQDPNVFFYFIEKNNHLAIQIAKIFNFDLNTTSPIVFTNLSYNKKYVFQNSIDSISKSEFSDLVANIMSEKIPMHKIKE